MKKVSLLVFLTLLFISCATTSASKSTKETLPDRQTIIDVEGLNQEELFVKANVVLVDLFKKSSSVIQFSDKSNGIIKGKFIIPEVWSGIYCYRINATITVEVKDFKTRLTISDIYATFVGDAIGGRYLSDGRDIKIETESKLGEKVQEELKNFEMNFSTGLKTKNEW